MLRHTAVCLSLLLIAAGCNQQTAEEKEALDNRDLMTEPATQTEAAAQTAEAEMEGSDRSTDTKTNAGDETKAVCELVPVGDSKVTGMIYFTKEGDQVHVKGEIKGLKPGKHGFHVHEKGDLSDKESGKSTGGHFNPADKPHGRPADSDRHVGDLGNIEANAEGVAQVDIVDNVIQLQGDHSILERSIVVHAGEDQFTQPTGDAGARVAFGKIVADKAAPAKN